MLRKTTSPPHNFQTHARHGDYPWPYNLYVTFAGRKKLQSSPEKTAWKHRDKKLISDAGWQDWGPEIKPRSQTQGKFY